MIATVCEDATCKIWEVPSDLEEESKEAAVPRVFNRSIETLKGHMGRNIRALTCHQGLLATGGDDGGIKVWNVAEILTKKSLQ
jgi:WD40 repeat protein